MLAKGRVVDGRFEIEMPAGSGGFGTVYKARDRLSGALVAVKVLHDERGSADDRARFAREGQLLAELHHPNIVAFVADGMTEEGAPFLVMEWLEGESVAERLERDPLALGATLQLLRGAANGLAEAHRRGIVHRDLKPSNLLLRAGSVTHVMLLDLGIARRANLALTRTGQVMGTPRYMSPEQGWGREVTPAADVFALGCVAYECLTGLPAFDAEHPAAALAKLLFERAPALAAARPDLPPQLLELVDRMLASEPSHRPRDGAELLAELDALSPLLDGPAPSNRAPASRFGRDELRLASVLVADGSSSIDPLLATELASRASYVERRARDGALVATFLHEGPSAVDQAANAATVARLVRERWTTATVAVVTGRVREAQRAEGPLVERAAVLASAASNAISFDDVTVSLLEGRLRTVVRNGVSIADDEVMVDESRLLLGQPTLCVGREQELSTLEHVFDSSVEEGVARAVLVTADAGAGKSRLRHELLRRLDATARSPLVLLGRAEATREGASYGVLEHALRGLFGGPDRVTKQARIRERVGQRLVGDDAARVTEFLGELVGAPLEDSPRLRSARVDPRSMRAQVIAAWVDFLRAECRVRPVLLLLEDLHWSDAASLDLVDVALRELCDAPLVVVGFARHELTARRPGLWRGHVQELPLQPLGRRACDQLVRGVLGDRIAPADVERLVVQSAGNALFLEELIRAHDVASAEVPATVLAMLQARIGRLEVPLRRVLRAASIFGDSFVLSGVVALHDDGTSDAAALELEVERWLTDLIRGELVAARRPDEGTPLRVYRFRHALMREAAYALVTDEDRVTGHHAAATFLAANSGEPAIVAEHFALAGDIAAAAIHLEAAAARAYDNGDIEGAGGLAKRGLSLGIQGPIRGAMLAIAANNHLRAWSWQAGVDAMEEALLLLAPGSIWWSRAVTAAITFYAYRNERAAAVALSERFLGTQPEPAARLHYADAAAHIASAMLAIGGVALGRQALARIAAVTPDLERYPGVDAFVLLIQCTLLRNTVDDMAEQIRAARRSVGLYDQVGGEPLTAAIARDTLGEVLYRAGQSAEAETVLRGALAAARLLSASYARTHVSLAFAHGLLVREAPESDAEAEELARAVLATEGISAGYEAMSRHVLAQVMARRGERQRAAAEADRAIALSEHTPVRRLQMLATRARLHERAEDALATIETALALLESMNDEGGYAEASVLLAAAEVLDACGHRGRAQAAIGAARRGVLARADAFDDLAHRELFLCGVPLHARIVARAADLLD